MAATIDDLGSIPISRVLNMGVQLGFSVMITFALCAMFAEGLLSMIQGAGKDNLSGVAENVREWVR